VNNPADFARLLCYDPARITKTLLVRSIDGGRFALIVLPAADRVNFAHLAKIIAAKKVQVASEAELQIVAGYPRLGVSPVGVPSTSVFVDEGLLTQETVLIGSGLPGVEVELKPADLIKLTRAEILPLVVRTP
jgi:Cys-tRNA(Pro)/Cys-tRNA(Cys) deacylase